MSDKRNYKIDIGDLPKLFTEDIFSTKKRIKFYSIDGIRSAKEWIEELFNLIKTLIGSIFIISLMIFTATIIINSIRAETFISGYQAIVMGILEPIADFSKLIESDARFIAVMIIFLGIFSAKAIKLIIRFSGIKNLSNFFDKAKK